MAEEGGAETNVRKAKDALEQCEEKVEELQEENEQLRQSAQAFGDLAERLNTKPKPAAPLRAAETTSKR